MTNTNMEQAGYIEPQHDRKQERTNAHTRPLNWWNTETDDFPREWWVAQDAWLTRYLESKYRDSGPYNSDLNVIENAVADTLREQAVRVKNGTYREGDGTTDDKRRLLGEQMTRSAPGFLKRRADIEHAARTAQRRGLSEATQPNLGKVNRDGERGQAPAAPGDFHGDEDFDPEDREPVRSLAYRVPADAAHLQATGQYESARGGSRPRSQRASTSKRLWRKLKRAGKHLSPFDQAVYELRIKGAREEGMLMGRERISAALVAVGWSEQDVTERRVRAAIKVADALIRSVKDSEPNWTMARKSPAGAPKRRATKWDLLNGWWESVPSGEWS